MYVVVVTVGRWGVHSWDVYPLYTIPDKTTLLNTTSNYLSEETQIILVNQLVYIWCYIIFSAVVLSRD